MEYDPGSGDRKTIHEHGDAAQKRAQEKEREERIKKYNAMTAEEHKKYDAQREARARFTAKASDSFSSFLEQNLAKSQDQLLPNYAKAEISPKKLSSYILNMDHPKGRSKAIAFRDALGYTVDNQNELQEALRDGLTKWKATARAVTDYGKPFEVRMLLTGSNGKQATVKTGWQIDSGTDVPRLVSAYVYKKKG